MVKVFLKPGKELPVLRFHPWVFSGAIARLEGNPDDGDVAEVYSKRGELLGVGHFHHGSIAVRLLHFGAADLQNTSFWLEKLRNALAVRTRAGLAGQTNTNCFRLIHGEGDGLSGLVVDVYGATAVVQCHSIGMHRQRERIADALRQLPGLPLEAVYDKSVEALPAKYAETCTNGYLWSASAAPAGNAVVVENGVHFKVDWETGQKTGFFLDQRDNRRLLAQFAPGKTVLNAFCYSGGFSVYALKAGAAKVDSVDSSKKAMELTDRNVALNGFSGSVHESITDDVMHFLRQPGDGYDVVIIDPPAFAKNISKRHQAVQGYRRLNALALQKVKPGGILFTFSCSQVVDKPLFYNTIVAAALEAGRPVRLMHDLGQPADHPVSLYHPESSYLKGLALYVE